MLKHINLSLSTPYSLIFSLVFLPLTPGVFYYKKDYLVWYIFKQRSSNIKFSIRLIFDCQIN